MSEDNDAGASYLAALRHSSASQAPGAAPARAPSPVQSANPVIRNEKAIKGIFSKTEKRRSPRYKCTGSARVQASGTASIWARFTDISIHGCYVESAAPYPKGTTVRLKLEANNFHIEATGEVSVAYPGLGMGISFTIMSESDNGRLRELVRSVSRRTLVTDLQVAPQTPSIGPSEVPPVSDPGAALKAMTTFFENRHMMGREEFLRILRENR